MTTDTPYTADRRERLLAARTDRLLRRRHGYMVPRDTWLWSGVQLSIALHDFDRILVRQLILPTLNRLRAALDEKGAGEG